MGLLPLPTFFFFTFSALRVLPLLLLLLLLPSHLPGGRAQQAPAAPSPIADACNGVLLSYAQTSRTRIHPFLPANQPYAFRASATILNSDSVPLDSWSLLLGFPNGTVLVSASSAVLTDGTPFPAVLGPDGASFSGFPATDLKTAIETAGDLTQIRAQVDIVGTQFGSPRTGVPMPAALALGNPGYLCPAATRPGGANGTEMFTCCTRDPKAKFNESLSDGEEFLPRSSGDLSISYDVMQTFPTSYIALVTIANGSPLGRLDNWRLTWQWMRGEFIQTMRGAYPSVVDASECIFGAQGQFYKDFDFSKIASCQRSPTILDLPASMANDTNVGMIPSCCRNGTILPASMDPSKSASAFQLQVYKMPPDLNRTKINPPQNWRIAGAPGSLNPTYRCGPPVRVSPTSFPDPSGLQSSSSAIASWQVVCNITRARGESPRCCVSFSAFYNESVVPCRTCACGCPDVPATCNATAPALLLPSEALLVPFDNRTAKARAWAEIKHLRVPNPMPCGDYCGVSINWHVYTDYRNGWTARVTLFNWEDSSFPDWFTAVRMGKAYAGFETMYSFNATAMGNNTIFMQGNPGLNYLQGEVAGSDPAADPRVPGKQQSVISFTKKTTPGIDVVAGDGFPTEVFFNGEKCSLPDTIPTSTAYRATAVIGGFWSMAILLAVAAIVLMER
uniref:COBRA-like protein 7 n=1 Tax=Anthurium amnicola TaxID=1678845 RepID=A0A1D1XNH5_9ARAE